MYTRRSEPATAYDWAFGIWEIGKFITNILVRRLIYPRSILVSKAILLEFLVVHILKNGNPRGQNFHTLFTRIDDVIIQGVKKGVNEV